MFDIGVCQSRNLSGLDGTQLAPTSFLNEEGNFKGLSMESMAKRQSSATSLHVSLETFWLQISFERSLPLSQSLQWFATVVTTPSNLCIPRKMALSWFLDIKLTLLTGIPWISFSPSGPFPRMSKGSLNAKKIRYVVLRKMGSTEFS